MSKQVSTTQTAPAASNETKAAAAKKAKAAHCLP
jgi:hypothetical protein